MDSIRSYCWGLQEKYLVGINVIGCFLETWRLEDLNFAGSPVDMLNLLAYLLSLAGWLLLAGWLSSSLDVVVMVIIIVVV
jgi:hypothetical protein